MKVRNIVNYLCSTNSQVGVGEVIKLGPGVSSPNIGDLVGVKWSASACLSCGMNNPNVLKEIIITKNGVFYTDGELLDNCLEGGETTCPTGTISGYLTPGTFQQYCLSSAAYVTPIPKELDLAGAAALMCGGITVFTAIKRANVKHGQWVVISGAGGGLGHLAIQYAKVFGARVLALDIGSKEAFCLGLGAEVFVDFSQFESDGELVAHIKDVTGGGAKVVLACSSSNRAYSQAISFLGFRGVLVCIGVPEGKPIPIEGANVGDLVVRELNIFGTYTPV